MLPSIRDKEKKRLEIARSLAASYFDDSKLLISSQLQSQSTIATLPSLKVSTPDNSFDSLRQKRLKSTLKMMKKSEHIYNMEVEKKLITEYNLNIVEKELEKISSKDYNRINIIIELVVTQLKAALFGCDVDIGICTDSSLKEIEYFGDRNYVRKLPRRDGITAFTCIDRKEIVLEVIDYFSTLIAFIFQNDLSSFPFLRR